MLVTLLCLISGVVVWSAPLETVEKVQHGTWLLAMNLNPADGHIMGYTTGWADNVFIGTYAEALTKDYLNRIVWDYPVSYIAIARHQSGKTDAVKVFRFKESARSLLSRFQAMNPGSEVVTEGGPLQESVSANAQNMNDDPIFSVGGDLVFNWRYKKNGHRIVLTGGNLSPANVNDDNTYGLGNDLDCNPLTGTSNSSYWSHEISNIQDCPLYNCTNVRLQGTDHGPNLFFKSGPVYGNYAIYVSEDAYNFPEPGINLDLEIDVIPKRKYFST